MGKFRCFLDLKNHHILLTDLREEKHRATLRTIWTDPYSLDPPKKATEVTRDIVKCRIKPPRLITLLLAA